ncbi:MAG: hypothetical protein N3I86_05010 [Verrucomicrobiae bacterium]|nr:hypothetical protein [Verrucomicrobiae bacterium]MDW8310117.1 hypothetical protein [Verrucomicrobiales bacterium]
MKAKAAELRALIRQSHRRPVRLHLSDGRSFTITHPDFAAVGEDAVVLLRGPGIDLGDAHFAICDFEHIVRIEGPSKKSKAAA